MRFARFFTVGALNTLLTLAAFNVFLLLSLPAPASNALAYSLGTVNSFYWNRRWTFADREGLEARRTFWRFALVIGGSLVITTAIVWALEPLIPVLGLDAFVPRVVSINAVEGVAVLVGFVWNYVLVNKWAFAGRPSSSEQQSSAERPSSTEQPTSAEQ